MKLELKDLAPYLPYEFKGIAEFLPDVPFKILGFNKTRVFGETINGNNVPIGCDLDEFKPILRPLSDLDKEVEINGEKFIPINKILVVFHTYDDSFDATPLLKDQRWFNQMPYGLIELLLEWHFDVFGLIPKGLAIDINTIK